MSAWLTWMSWAISFKLAELSLKATIPDTEISDMALKIVRGGR